MERLTKYVKNQGEYVIDCKCKSCDTCKENILDLCSMQDKVIQKCGEYENTGLAPQEVEKLVKENAELKAKLEKSVELPCKVGDMVYYYSVFMSGMLQAKASEVIFDKWGYKINVDGRIFTNRELNIKFFFDKEKAKQALKERKKNE